MRNNIRDTEPSTSYLRRNVYHLHVPLFVLDAIRLFQDHPKYVKGLQESHIVALWEKEWVKCSNIVFQDIEGYIYVFHFVAWYFCQGSSTLGRDNHASCMSFFCYDHYRILYDLRIFIIIRKNPVILYVTVIRTANLKIF